MWNNREGKFGSSIRLVLVVLHDIESFQQYNQIAHSFHCRCCFARLVSCAGNYEVSDARFVTFPLNFITAIQVTLTCYFACIFLALESWRFHHWCQTVECQRKFTRSVLSALFQSAWPHI